MDPIATTSAALPDTLGRYELLGLIGRGGMANVYLGRHAGGAGFQRLFAIKVLHPHLAHEEAFIEMLRDEARIAARLHHPNVVPIVDLGTQDGIYYVVMEYVEGCALSVLLKKNRDLRPARLIIPIILDALSGLHAAHALTDDDGASMRLVHRDVSPQNILVGVDGVARLTDFGIAKAESRINSTRPGELKGKISFMSPEQIHNPELVDHRSDVFSAGVLLWTALTGKQLFEAESTGAAMNNTLRMAIEPPSRVGLRPPAVFDAICLRALERNVEARPESALAFEESLRSVATANGLCGSRREVGNWVLATVGEELAERRSANRSSGHQRVANRIHSPAGGIGAASSSRLRVDGALTDMPSVESISFVSSSHAATHDSAPVIESAPISARELGTEGRRRARWLLTGGGVLLLGGLVWAVRLDLAEGTAPALASSAAKPGPVSIAKTSSPPGQPREQTTTPAADDELAAPRAPESKSAKPSTMEPTRRRAPPMAVRRSAPTALQPVAVATPAPTPSAESAAASERVKKPIWDEDSPLPHP